MTKLPFALALAASTLSSPVFAAERLPDVRVAYQDLRLGETAGQRTLDRRISAAIETACDLDARAINLAEKRAAKRCIAAKQAEVAPLRAAALASRGVPVQIAARAY